MTLRRIAPEHHELVFREFAQVDASDAREKAGFGLGLALAKKIVSGDRLIRQTVVQDRSPLRGSELLGKTTFTELTFLLVQRRDPSPGETRLLDAVLVALADHGLTPTVLAARLTHTGAPESLQGAMAAGTVSSRQLVEVYLARIAAYDDLTANRCAR